MVNTRVQLNSRSSYSIQCGYVVINNLPRRIRYLRENMFLVFLFPGPTEPPYEAMEELLKPLVDDLLEFEDGKLLS